MRKFNWRIFPVLLATLSVAVAGGGAQQARGAEPPGGARRSSLGTISGAVLDRAGNPVAGALADGFTPATFSSVEVSPATELVYRFNLQPVGEGNTRPERRADRNDPKFRIRAAAARRS